MERRKKSWPAPEPPIGEEKANRKSPEFTNRTKPMKTKTHRNSNSNSKRVFRFIVRAPIAKEASSNIAPSKNLVNSMDPKEKVNS
jgi:hypothetical protein